MNFLGARLPAALVCALLMSATQARAQWSFDEFASYHSRLVPIPDTVQNRALMEATYSGDVAALKSAFAKGASSDLYFKIRGDSSKVPLFLMPYYRAQNQDRSKNLAIFRTLLKHAKNVNAASQVTGQTALIASIGLRDFDSARDLVVRGADVNARLKDTLPKATALLLTVAIPGPRGDAVAYGPSFA